MRKSDGWWAGKWASAHRQGEQSAVAVGATRNRAHAEVAASNASRSAGSGVPIAVITRNSLGRTAREIPGLDATGRLP